MYRDDGFFGRNLPEKPKPRGSLLNVVLAVLFTGAVGGGLSTGAGTEIKAVMPSQIVEVQRPGRKKRI